MAAAQPTINLPKVYLPTGFEREQALAAQKAELAKAMLARGLANDTHMVSPVQVLGHLAQAWAGKSMQNSALNDQVAAGDKMLAAYQGALEGFNKDVTGGLSEGDLVQKYQGNPMLQQALAPHLAAYQHQLEKSFDTKDSATSSLHNPQSWVIMGADGQLHLNPLRTTAAIAGAGGNLTGLPQSMPYEAMMGAMQGAQGAPQVAPPPDVPPTPAPGGPGLPANPPGQVPFGNPLDQSSILNSRHPNGVLPGGKPYWIINGAVYDNPDGQ